MHSTGITASRELVQQWSSLKSNNKVPFVQFGITKETFVINESGTADSTSDPQTNFAAAAASLQPKVPAYIPVRVTDEKWALVFYMPILASVQNKLVYAASLSGLKAGLGTDCFLGDYYISEPKECSYEEYKKSQQKIDKTELMNVDEALANLAIKESAAGKYDMY